MSQKSTAIALLSPQRPSRSLASWLVISRSASSRTSRRNVTSPRRRVWQARRTSGPNPSDVERAFSASFRSSHCSTPSRIQTRQVEHLAWPPQAWARGTPASNAPSRMVSPRPTSKSRLSGRQMIFGMSGQRVGPTSPDNPGGQRNATTWRG